MKKKNVLSNLAGILFVSIVGSLMHFVYDWSNQNPVVGLFAATNESTWEHMKLIFFPMLLYFFIESFFIDKDTRQKTADRLSVLIGTVLIPVLFYTYRGILGFGLAPLDISTFFISVLAAFYARHKITSSKKAEKWAVPALIGIICFWTAFFLFTYFPPNLGIFQSPV